ncbi:ABC transporter ATP-binding protein [Streptomyces natalensis]|uniref:Sulfate ABC transporter ATP-binding protein n=1 Tax=Streptomyces natalensis ATCC 27448 TaxID=1240678 RepID=A0A0D7CEF8_9ACTN|nr:ABC transporter ATP-binding protein [Streptomyces natalensis]KIZ14265.1 sulfate ABC transporter ATP-binding protein [Streptomyces natalensis ATCC 27448]
MTTTATTTATAAQSAGPAPVVSFRGVSKSYGAVRAVADLDLELHPGETVALLGPNGAGKSSTLDLLLGLRTPDSGSLSLFGTTPQCAIEDGRVGAMLQSGGLMEGVKVKELVGLARDLHPRAYPLDQILETAGITDIAERMVGKLSGGQEQRVRFALATAGANDLIVLDEPTTGMDVSARQTFWGAMREQALQGRTVLFATHYLEEADAIADRVIVLHRGRVLADGTAAEIKARAGARRISFDLDAPVDRDALSALPFLTSLSVSDNGSAADSGRRTVRIQSQDADATVHALYGLGAYPRNLEVSGLGLEQAFIALTTASDATSATAEEAAR